MVEFWLQRFALLSNESELEFESRVKLCKVASGKHVQIWNNDWIGDKRLQGCLESKYIQGIDPYELPQIIQPEEIELFKRKHY